MQNNNRWDNFFNTLVLFIQGYWVLFVIAILWFICTIGTSFYVGRVLEGILLAIFIPIGVVVALIFTYGVYLILHKIAEEFRKK